MADFDTLQDPLDWAPPKAEDKPQFERLAKETKTPPADDLTSRFQLMTDEELRARHPEPVSYTHLTLPTNREV